jgi:dTDP-4-amino-4,6-dideoxygalactose transaminase
MTPPTSLPALLGGPAVRPQGPPAWPPADEDVRAALEAAWRDGSWGKYNGGHVERLEEALKDYHQVEYALACGSGTFAVELALRALRIGPGDEVILAAYDYPGNFLSVHAVGARPVLVDVGSADWQLSVERVAEAVGPATKAIIASHMHGGLVDMRRLTALAAEHGLAVIEDAAQCPGAVVQGRKAGTWGDAGVLSFGGSKLLTAGRGGALLTTRADVHQRARTTQMRGNAVSPLSELQAAALLPQLRKLDGQNAHRLRIARELTAALEGIPALRPFACTAEGSSPAYYKVGLGLDTEALGLSRERFAAAVRAEGIALDEGFRALHHGRSPSRFRRGGPLDEAGRAHAGALVLHHPVLLGTTADVAEVAAALKKVSAAADLLRR